MRGFQLHNFTTPGLFGEGGMDLAINSGGRIVLTTGAERIRHNVLKMILTGRSGEYGTNFTFVGAKRVVGLDALTHISIQNALQEYRSRQAVDLPDAEVITSIRSLQVLPDQKNPTRSQISLVLNMRDGNTLIIEHRFSTT